MYHIKNDKRSITSANALYRALIQMLNTTSLDKIKVTSLVKKAMVGRSTFYRNFDEPLDILQWKCDSLFNHVLERFSSKLKNGTSGRFSFIREVFEYGRKHSEVLEVLIDNSRIDVIEGATKSISEYLKKVDDPEQVSSPYYQYSINLRLSILVGMMITWINRGKKESVDELLKILIRTLKEIPIKPLLY